MTHLAVLGLLGACQKPETTTTDTDVTTSPDTHDTAVLVPTGSTGATGDTAPPAPTGDTGPATVEVDCSLVPAMHQGQQQVQGARAYHDVIFDLNGLVMGSNNDSIIWADYYGNSGVLVPGTGLVQGMAELPDGDFVAASDTSNSLFRFTAAGVRTNIVGDSGAYGVIVGPDGMIYTANYEVVERIDPVLGTRTTILDPPFSPKSINWNRDHTKLFIATGFGNGDVYAVDIDPVTLDPVAPGYVFATNVGSGTYHDCLAVDYCDNLYVCDYNTQTLYKIDPNGNVSDYINFPNGTYSHGAEFGSGVGGFRVDALYIAQPYNGNSIAEIVVGIPGRDWDGTGWTPPP